MDGSVSWPSLQNCHCLYDEAIREKLQNKCGTVPQIRLPPNPCGASWVALMVLANPPQGILKFVVVSSQLVSALLTDGSVLNSYCMILGVP